MRQRTYNKCAAAKLSALGLVTFLVACGGSLDTSANLSSSSPALGAALSSTFKEKVNETGSTVVELQRVIALTPLQPSSRVKTYFDTRKIEVIQTTLAELKALSPGVLYIDTSNYDTDSAELKEYLLSFGGVLILDGPDNGNSKEEVVTVNTNGLPINNLDNTTTEQGSVTPQNPKALALMINLGRQVLTDSNLYILTRKSLWMGSDLMVTAEKAQEQFDDTLKMLITDSYSESEKLANAASGTEFWKSGTSYVEKQMANNWWNRYSVDMQAAHNQTGGRQKIITIRVKTDGEINGRRMGFRRNEYDHHLETGEITKPHYTQQHDRWGDEDPYLFQAWVRAPHKFHTRISSVIHPDNTGAGLQVYETVPKNINDDRFKLGKEKSLKNVLVASLAIPGIGLGLGGGLPVYTGGYTDVWYAHANNDYNRRTDSKNNTVIQHNWGIHLKNTWTPEGLLYGSNLIKSKPTPWQCDVPGHKKGGCLNESVNAISKDGYSLGAGVSLTINSINKRSPVGKFKVGQIVGFVTCGYGTRELGGRTGFKWESTGCRNWEDSGYYRDFWLWLPPEAKANGVTIEQQVTANDVIQAMKDL